HRAEANRHAILGMHILVFERVWSLLGRRMRVSLETREMVQHRIKDQTPQQHPLRWVLLLWVGVVYVKRLLEGNTGPRLPTGGGIWIGMDPALFAAVAFTALLALHGTLHGIALFRTIHPRWLLPYFLGQGALMLLMLYLADEQSAVLGLCLVLT